MVHYLIITHPSATLLIPCGTFSYDLHVLSTPPAFILSQNQTLELNISAMFNRWCTFQILRSELCSASTAFVSSWQSQVKHSQQYCLNPAHNQSPTFSYGNSWKNLCNKSNYFARINLAVTSTHHQIVFASQFLAKLIGSRSTCCFLRSELAGETGPR